ncbi:bifunctional UDP-N-acetylglucosamine diphosphorylase/glucosamine-1-phosphate N-acetyltransferase GlmU [bacterium]|nr:bifunctional UDP-N-acetylglucosamine diphosphorylase/glucosamine-1-phosphate N-acetyltransferase GlmU [bacterium]
MNGQLACVILAAGRSTRFKSSKSKLLHELAGRPLVEWALDTLLQLNPAQVIIVYGPHSVELTQRYKDGYRGQRLDFVLQDPPLGTAHALAQTEAALHTDIENIIVLPGDAPLMTMEHLSQLAKVKAQLRCDHVVISAEVPNPYGYGRILRDPDSPEMVAMIVEEADASAEKKLLREINSSMYLFSSDVFEHLRLASELIGRSAVKGEYYLTDVARVSSMGAYKISDAALIEGLNDRLQLSQMDELVQRRLREKWMAAGVSFILPETTYLHSDIELGQDVLVGPQCYLAHGTRVGSGTVLQQGCHLDACTVGENCNLLHVHAHEAVIGNHVRVGPYANLRPGTVLGDEVRVGNFVETKKANVGRGSKLPHLSYVGDATIGSGCNIGAGTIFCNYDGVNKHHTTLGDGVFVGSNSSLQAPLSIGEGAFVAMASAVTRDVPAGALAVARARQENKTGYVERLRRRQKSGAEDAGPGPEISAEAGAEEIAAQAADSLEGFNSLGSDPGLSGPAESGYVPDGLLSQDAEPATEPETKEEEKQG